MQRRVVLIASTAAVLALGIGGWPSVASATPPYRVTATITVADGNNAVAVDPGVHNAYVTINNPGSIAVINETTNRVVHSIPSTAGPLGEAVDTTRHVDIVSTSTKIQFVNDRTNKVIGAYTASSSEYLGAVADDPSTGTAFILDDADTGPGDREYVKFVDVASRSETTNVQISDHPSGLAVDPKTHQVLVADQQSNTIQVISESSASVTRTIHTTNSPAAIAVDQNSGLIYLVENTPSNSSSIAVLNESTGNVVGTITSVSQPYVLAVDPSKNVIYAATENGRLGVINGSTRKVTATLAVAANYIAVDTSTHNVYLNGNGTVSVVTP